MEEKTCGSCKCNLGGHCMIPLYVDAEFYPGRVITDEKPACAMYEAKDAVSDK